MSKEKAKSNSKTNQQKPIQTFVFTVARTDWWQIEIPATCRAEAAKLLVNDAYDKSGETLITESEVKGYARVPKAQKGERQKFHVDEDHRQAIFVESVTIKE